jgi:nucleoid-associated protein YgaU
MPAQGNSTVTGVTSVRKQPTLRSGDLGGKSPPAEPPQSPGSDTTNQDAKKQSVAKSQHKKNSKKTPAAKPQTNVQTDEGKNEAKRPPSAADRTRDKDFVPPDFAREYRPYSEYLQAGKESSSEGRDESGRQKAADSSLSGDQPKLPKAPPVAEPRRHRIAEGDTLRQLAEKYLGSRDRYLELFQANADVLFDPRLIPIGVEIVIPDRTTVVAQAAADPTTADDSNNHSAPGHDAARDEWSSVPANETE